MPIRRPADVARILKKWHNLTLFGMMWYDGNRTDVVCMSYDVQTYTNGIFVNGQNKQTNAHKQPHVE